jgi:hypothetical protein
MRIMGYDARCTLRFDGSSSRGTAWLEHKDLVFRGTRRLSIPLASITEASATDGVLSVRFDGRQADFVVGDCAGKWAARITNPPSRLDKLGIKPGMSIVVIGAVESSFTGEVEKRGARVLKRVQAESSDIIFYAAEDRKALDRLVELKKMIVPAGAIWVVRPKGQKAITESDTMSAGKGAGLVDVKVVSFSDTHTAEKFVIPIAKRPKTRAAKS